MVMIDCKHLLRDKERFYLVLSKSDIIMSIAHSTESVFSVYLPSGDPKSNYDLNLTVHVQDWLGAWTESDVTTIKVE
jgi:uncharacterized membrane protein